MLIGKFSSCISAPRLLAAVGWPGPRAPLRPSPDISKGLGPRFYWGFLEDKQEGGRGKGPISAVFQGASTEPQSSAAKEKPRRFTGIASNALTGCYTGCGPQKPCEHQLFSKNEYFFKYLPSRIIWRWFFSWFEKFHSPTLGAAANPGE